MKNKNPDLKILRDFFLFVKKNIIKFNKIWMRIIVVLSNFELRNLNFYSVLFFSTDILKSFKHLFNTI